MVKCAQTSQTKGMHPLCHSFTPTRRCTVCIRMNTGTGQTFQTWSQTYIQIRFKHNSGGAMTTTKIDDNILHLFQHRPQVILGDITVTRKMDRTPDSAKQNDKSVFFSIRLFHERHMQNPVVCPTQCLCKVRSQTTRLAPSRQLRTSCSSITAVPMRCSTANFTSPASAAPRC